jgi:hypothetical protein
MVPAAASVPYRTIAMPATSIPTVHAHSVHARLYKNLFVFAPSSVKHSLPLRRHHALLAVSPLRGWQRIG